MAIDFNQWGAQEQDQKIDFQRIKLIATNSMEVVLQHWLPGGKVVRGEYLCGSTAGGPGESCSTNVKTGVGADFATGEKWGDAIELVSKLEGLSMGDAARRLEEFFSVGPDTEAPPPPLHTETPEERYEAGKKAALGLWVESEACPEQHPYLIMKQVPSAPGIRLHTATGNILVPLYDESGTLWSVQRIFPDGEKKISYHGKMLGNFFMISGERDTVYICEGYATAQTVAVATGKTVVVAVATANLLPVAKSIAKLYPTAHLVFAADNDNVTPKLPTQIKNPGITLAEKAVKELGRGTVIAPPAPPETKVDWNDFAIVHGAKATRDLLLVQSSKALPVLVDLMDFAPSPPTYLIDKLIETPCTGMVVGASGSGKTFVVLDWALSIATGTRWCGREVKKGPVIYICGEGKYGIARRTGAWYHKHGIAQQRGQFFLSTQRVEINQVAATQLVTDIDAIAQVHGVPALLVIDTLARSIPADADENSSNDMQAWINCIDSIRDRYNCTVLIVHHTGHADDAKGRARGSSALKGAMDLEVLVNKAKGLIECTKGKDMEPWSPIKYELKPVKVTEEWGSAVACFDLSYDPKKDRPETAYKKAARSALFEAVEADGLGGKCLPATWLSCFVAMFPDKSERTLRVALFRKDGGEATKMIEAGELEYDGKCYTPILGVEETTEKMFSALK